VGVHQCGRFVDDDRAVGVSLVLPGLKARVRSGELGFELSLAQVIEALE